MGAEDYQVVARFRENDQVNVDRILRKIGFTVEPSYYDWATNQYLVLEGPCYFIEAELSNTRISLRYAVRQPSEVNLKFASIIWQVQEVVQITEFVDAECQPSLYSFDSAEHFAIWLCEDADNKRRLWFADFPGEERKCRCQDAYDDVI